MSESKGGPWRIPPERAKTHAELRSAPGMPVHGSGGTGAASGASGAPVRATMRIGEVSERLGLSLRSIRYYEEAGLVTPSARTQGGFRLYTEPDVTRLLLVMQMKPLEFSLEEMREVFGALDALAVSGTDETASTSGAPDGPDSPGADVAHTPGAASAGSDAPTGDAARAKLMRVLKDVEERLELLRARVGIAESFREYLRTELAESHGGGRVDPQAPASA